MVSSPPLRSGGGIFFLKAICCGELFFSKSYGGEVCMGGQLIFTWVGVGEGGAGEERRRGEEKKGEGKEKGKEKKERGGINSIFHAKIHIA